ncbi:MAG: AAA family ATPase [Gammaproteobacteria bacterium]|nr:AAA family ATPase [Gammaproteobacteria bacterium]
MKIATVGKGGSGKTTVAGALARVLAEGGHKVLAVDGDPNPNLALTLGMSPGEAEQIKYIKPDIMEIEAQSDGTRKLQMTVSGEELIRQYGASAPQEIDLVVMGRPAEGSAGSGCMCASHLAVRGIIAEMSGHGDHTITDMEAGLEHLKRGTARNVDTMLVVAEPYYRSLEAAARTHLLARELRIPYIFIVANKVKEDDDLAAIKEFCSLHDMPILATVPYDPLFTEAERNGKSPIDYAPNCPGMNTIREIAEELAALEVPESADPGLPQRRRRKPAACTPRSGL